MTMNRLEAMKHVELHGWCNYKLCRCDCHMKGTRRCGTCMMGGPAVVNTQWGRTNAGGFHALG